MICVAEATVAVRFEGAVGGVMSGDASVEAVAVDEKALKLAAASVARTR